jgi:hypothetical protein
VLVFESEVLLCETSQVILTAHQPVYLPWLGLFHKIALAESFCVFDIVQYQKKDYNNRNRIKTHTGPMWLSVPVESKNHLQTMNCDVKIIDNGWHKKHAKSIRFNYKAAPYFDQYIDIIEEQLLNKKFKYLTDLNFEMLSKFLELLDIKVNIIKASDLDFSGQKSELVLDMCIKLGSKKYIFGEQGKNYVDRAVFAKSAVDVYFQKYIHPTYKQINGKFSPYMSVIDLLFNAGPESKKIIMKGNASTVDELEGPDPDFTDNCNSEQMP